MMKAYNNSNRAKDLLLQFQIYAKTLSKRGPTDITVRKLCSKAYGNLLRIQLC